MESSSLLSQSPEKFKDGAIQIKPSIQAEEKTGFYKPDNI
jgi:hypothetical protein